MRASTPSLRIPDCKARNTILNLSYIYIVVSVRSAEETGAHVLVKTHEWTGEITPAMFDQAAELFTHVVVSVREGFEKDPAWMKVATHAPGL